MLENYHNTALKYYSTDKESNVMCQIYQKSKIIHVVYKRINGFFVLFQV